MGQWTDLFLSLPLPESWLHMLLFVSFGLHLLFVLLMLGTAMLGLTFFIQAWLSGDGNKQLWNKQVVTSHLGLKSLAVVLGVAPLLLIQIRYSHAFFTVTGLFSYTWLAVIPLLIFAFLAIDAFGHKIASWPPVPFLCGVLGVAALMTVPAIFTGALSLMERQESWTDFAARGVGLDASFAPHWLLRYLHVLGAAVVFGAAFHLFFSVKSQPEKAKRLRAWIFGATLFQVTIGIPLVFTVADALNWPVLLAVTIGTATAMLTLWSLRPATSCVPNPFSGYLLLLLPVLFVAMLVARQFLQDGALTPAHAQAKDVRIEASKALTPYREAALDAFKTKLQTVYNNGATIYEGACLPCHGQNGRGGGPAARRLLIPAEDLTAIRADRDTLYGILINGTNGSAMPYFRLFDRDKLESLLDELGSRFSMFEATPAPAHGASAEAVTLWDTTCATCHGKDGMPSAFGQTLLPPPPNLKHFSLTPERAIAVITDGYPGTVMQPYRALPEAVRQDLVTIGNGFRAVR
jgi:mono/diheme cytochrome c family protein